MIGRPCPDMRKYFPFRQSRPYYHFRALESRSLAFSAADEQMCRWTETNARVACPTSQCSPDSPLMLSSRRVQSNKSKSKNVSPLDYVSTYRSYFCRNICLMSDACSTKPQPLTQQITNQKMFLSPTTSHLIVQKFFFYLLGFWPLFLLCHNDAS